MIIPQRHNNPRIVTAGCSVTLIITVGSICSGAFFLPPGFPRAAITVALTRRPGCERHINSILRSVVRELVLHRVILTLWVKEDLGGFHWTEPTRVGCDWQNQHRGHVSESVRGTSSTSEIKTGRFWRQQEGRPGSNWRTLTEQLFGFLYDGMERGTGNRKRDDNIHRGFRTGLEPELLTCCRSNNSDNLQETISTQGALTCFFKLSTIGS